MNQARVIHLVEGLKRSRTGYYLLSLVFLFLMPVMVGNDGCLVTGPDDEWYTIPAYLEAVGCSEMAGHFRLREEDIRWPPVTAKVAAERQYAAVWLEFGATGEYPPSTASLLDELTEKGYIAIRVPHAPPRYTASVFAPHAVTFSYYTPPSATELTTVPINVTRRFDYEAMVNARFPIADGQSHWEVWWLPEGEGFPIPDQAFRLDKDSQPPTLEVNLQIDFVDADAIACAGCMVEVLFYNGYVFLGPYEQALRYTWPSIPPDPLATFGVTCGYKNEGLFPSLVQVLTPMLPFTHTFCLENWDTLPRTFTISASSSQGWDYSYYYQTTEGGSVPVPVPGSPFTVTVGPLDETWWPGMLALMAVHTPTITDTDTMRETLELRATSVISPEVRPSALSFALAPGYQLNEAVLGLRLDVVGQGTVIKEPDRDSYRYGDVVTLTATADAGWTFSDWSGDVESAANPLVLAMDAGKALTATFEIKTYVITPTTGLGGVITPGTPQRVSHGDDITFTIAADSGYHIADVVVDGISQGAINSYPFIHVTANHTISATFALSIAPYFVSADHGVFFVGREQTFMVRATGVPTPTIERTGTLPEGLTFTDGGDGTATLSGTPAGRSAGVYPLVFSARNNVAPDAVQVFTLTVQTKVYVPLVLKSR